MTGSIGSYLPLHNKYFAQRLLEPVKVQELDFGDIMTVVDSELPKMRHFSTRRSRKQIGTDERSDECYLWIAVNPSAHLALNKGDET